MQILALRPASFKLLKPDIHFGWVNRDYPNYEVSIPTSLPEKTS